MLRMDFQRGPYGEILLPLVAGLHRGLINRLGLRNRVPRRSCPKAIGRIGRLSYSTSTGRACAGRQTDEL